MHVFIIIAFIAVVIGAIVFNIIWQQKRREALGNMALSLQLNYSIEDPFNIHYQLGHIDAFSRGHSQRARNVVHGKYHGRDVVGFDFKYTTTEHTTDSKGRSSARNVDHHFSACVTPLECPFPKLMIRPETFFDRIGDFFGFDDIDFESDEFSRAFRVMCEDRKFAYDICHPRAMEFMLASRKWHIEMTGGYFVMRTESRWSAEEFHAAFSFLARFFELVPDFVRQQYRGRMEAQEAEG